MKAVTKTQITYCEKWIETQTEILKIKSVLKILFTENIKKM
jgi:hypothetical protein